MHSELYERTKEYIHYFSEKNTAGILTLLHDDFELTDPQNHIKGKHGVSFFLAKFFKNDISFCGKDVFVDGDHSIIHFELQVNEELLKGVDIIKWQDGKMISLVAYL